MGNLSRLPNRVTVVGVGGNIGGPQNVHERCLGAIAELSALWGEARVSNFYITAPQGPMREQPDFVNAVAVWQLRADTPPEAIQLVLQEVERSRGRIRLKAGGARTLDLDFLLYGDQIRSDEILTLPHPRMVNRRFVLQPLADLFGLEFSWIDLGTTVGELLKRSEVCSQKISKFS